MFSASGRTEVRFADLDDGGASTNRDGRVFTAPSVFPNPGKINYRIITGKPLPKGSEIISTDVSSKSLRFEIAAVRSANAAVGGTNVVSRADWGADEGMRYKDSSTWKAYFEKLEKE